MDIKIYIILFVLFLTVHSPLFNNILLKINGTTNTDGSPNNYGLVIQGIFLVISFAVMEALVSHEIL